MSVDNKPRPTPRAVTVFKSKTETAIFSQNQRQPKLRFLAPDERFFKSEQQAIFTVAA